MPAEPEGARAAAIKTITESFDDETAERLIQAMAWDSVLGCFWFMHGGCFYGVEPDGYMHM